MRTSRLPNHASRACAQRAVVGGSDGCQSYPSGRGPFGCSAILTEGWPGHHGPGVDAQGQAQSFTHAATQAATRMPTKTFSEQVRGLAGLQCHARRD